MAKWGEGDPRWIVEERPDAKNVNNWHWIEKDASNWSKEKFKKILIGTEIKTDLVHCKITEVSKCEGDTFVSNRRAKLIIFYEWTIEMKWIGSLINNDTKIEGIIEVLNFSEENNMKIVEINVHVETVGPESAILKNEIERAASEVIGKQLNEYVAALKEFSKELILPTKDNLQHRDLNNFRTIKKIKELEQISTNSNGKQNIETREIKAIEAFKCTASEFYQAMTIKELVEAFTQGNCVLEPIEGGKFELFDGNVQGYFTKLVPHKTIKQKWRFRTWPEEHFSEVHMDINQKTDCTEIYFSQTGIPKSEIENTREGWKRFYWNSLRRAFSFGAPLF
ncbi:activator of 90 kDa heat shock protein ATPase homolog 1 [Trichonephila clavata]|uniref:Activator of 90 kDa heat shock protein ATPase homolog 1 n=1 Tax=Trichonephila clavata TaxID=2740835 RepID=A0A8X6HZ97_TRICU|nr:activator of 90 kDa heat shock protein ATPase homolog 1 [Trichonephila clavata]